MTRRKRTRLSTDTGSSFAIVIMLTAFVLATAALLIDASQEYVFQQKLGSLTKQIALTTKSITNATVPGAVQPGAVQPGATRLLTDTATNLLAEFEGKSPSGAQVLSATMNDGQTLDLVLCATFDAPFKMIFVPPVQICEEARAR